jgi:hypothetical protein
MELAKVRNKKQTNFRQTISKKVRGVCVAYLLALAFTSDLEEISSRQISRRPYMAEKINGVRPLGEEMELAKVRNKKQTNFRQTISKKVRGVCVAYRWPLAFTSDLEEISSLQISRRPLSAEQINGVLPLGEEMELAKVRNEKQTNFR